MYGCIFMCSCAFYAFRTHLGWLKLSISGSAITHLPGCFCPWRFSVDIGLNVLPCESFMSCLTSLLGYFKENSGLCNWSSLRYLVPWIDHLPPVCWSTFWKLVCNASWFVRLTYSKTTFSLFLSFYIRLNISQYDNTLMSFTLFSCLK